jgi:hypothetical protein
MTLGRRGLDPGELRRRLVATEEDSDVTFERRTLGPPPEPAPVRGRPPWLPPLMPNSKGHDPWERRGWGAAFFLTPDGRMYRVDGYQWFYYLDADGESVQTADGHPIGYRWRVEPTPAMDMEQEFEVLPMPPEPVGNWPRRPKA